MKLPSLKFSLPFIFLCWCVAGVQTFGWVILAYPAMWAVIAVFFYGLHVVTRATAGKSSTSSAAVEKVQPMPIADDSPTDHKISAPV